MTKQIIITCLRGTIGRWPKGKAIVIPVLILIVPLSPWRGVRGEAAGQGQTFTHSEDVGMGACIKKK